MLYHTKECIAFAKGKYDTHKAEKDGWYTIVADGEYLVFDGMKVFKKHFKAGDRIRTPYSISSRHCPGFYEIQSR